MEGSIIPMSFVFPVACGTGMAEIGSDTVGSAIVNGFTIKVGQSSREGMVGVGLHCVELSND